MGTAAEGKDEFEVGELSLPAGGSRAQEPAQWRHSLLLVIVSVMGHPRRSGDD